MSVVESGVVDGIGLADNETMKMLITDHLDWQDEYQHLLMLQEKINSYIGFCESGQYQDVYADTSIKHIIFEIDGTEYCVCFRDNLWKGVYDVSVQVLHREADVKIKDVYPPLKEVILELWRIYIPSWLKWKIKK